MCFSPEVDLAVGVAITFVGVDALRNCPDKRFLPLAATPLLFAVHSFSSALVWCGFTTNQPAWITTVATAFYAVFAFVILPILIPLAILFIDWNTNRRFWLFGLLCIGAFTALDFGTSIVRGDLEAIPCSNYIDFGIVGSGWWTGVLYVLATCGGMMFSSHRLLQYWGALNLFVVMGLGLAQNQGLPSLWCFLAAATSVFVAVFLRTLGKKSPLLSP